MESSLDDDIELLRQTNAEESGEDSAFGYSNLDSGLNPFDLIKRGCSPGDSIDPASVHALQTAFASLQKKYNDEVKKKKELLHDNQAMKKALMDATQGNQGQFQNMDEYLQDPSMVHAAGGTSEDESLAESRAKQGYCQHLQRELLIANNSVQKGNEEISRLKSAREELEREITKHLKKNDELHSEIELIREILNQAKEESSRKDLEIAQMKNAVQSEQEANHTLRITIDTLQQRYQADHRGSITEQNEIQNLQSKLEVSEKERIKSVTQFRELEKRFWESENKVGVLEAKCKQYEIEVNINRTQRHEKMEDFDDVDGDVATLQRALSLLSAQRDEVADLKKKLAEQQLIITQIQTSGKRFPEKSLDTSFRPEAQGSSFHPHYVEQQVPVYANYPNPNAVHDMQSGHSPLSRRSSDRSDYRGSDTARRTSPRVNDNILPTGNQIITPMLAMESNQLPKRMEIAGIVDTGARTRSPGENTVDARSGSNVRSGLQGSTFPRTSVSGNQTSFAQQIPMNTVSPRPRNTNESHGSAFTELPRTREDVRSPNMSDNRTLVDTNAQDLAYIQAGARPRVPTGSVNYSKQYSNSQEPASPRPRSQQIPDRMTQSEIIVRDKQTDSNPMTRSVLEPLQPLEIPTSGNSRQSKPLRAEIEGIGQHALPRTASEHIYQNEYRGQYNGPDYENIYNATAETEVKRQIEEHDDTIFVTNNPRDFNNVSRPVQEETVEGNVSAVKICPVCNEEFSRLTLDQFQMHVFECFDNCDESPATLKPVAGGTANDDDRNCPMCGDVFPQTIPQETYEQHVLAHFGEDPVIERFELLQP